MALFDEYEVPKELTEDAYDALELARDTGKIKRGSNEVTKTIERGQAKLVYLAKDVEPEEVIAHLPLLCKEKAAPFIFVPSKDELGVSSGLEVSTASVAVVKSGKAAPKIKEIIDNLDALSKGEELPIKKEKAKKEEVAEEEEIEVPEEPEVPEVPEEPAKEEPAKEEPAKEKPAKEKPAKEEPAKEKPAKEKPKKAPAKKPAKKATKEKPKTSKKTKSKGEEETGEKKAKPKKKTSKKSEEAS